MRRFLRDSNVIGAGAPTPDARGPEAKARSPFLIYSGWMGTAANQDGISYLVDDIWPLLRGARPDLRLSVVGGGMPSALASKLAGVSGVEVVGEVADVRPYCRQASLSLVSLRIGSGTRLKILEAMSQGNVVVSTRRGAEGIRVKDGEHLFLADEPKPFAQAVLRVLSEPQLFDRVRRAGRTLVEKHYDWDVIGEMSNQALIEAMDRCRERRRRD